MNSGSQDLLNLCRANGWDDTRTQKEALLLTASVFLGWADGRLMTTGDDAENELYRDVYRNMAHNIAGALVHGKWMSVPGDSK